MSSSSLECNNMDINANNKRTKRRPTSTRLGRKRTKTAPGINGSCVYASIPSSNTTIAKNVIQRDKLRKYYIDQLEKLENDWPSFKKSKLVEIENKKKLLNQQLCSLQTNMNHLQQCIAIKREIEQLDQEMVQLNNNSDLHLIDQLKRIIQRPLNTINNENVSINSDYIVTVVKQEPGETQSDTKTKEDDEEGERESDHNGDDDEYNHNEKIIPLNDRRIEHVIKIEQEIDRPSDFLQKFLENFHKSPIDISLGYDTFTKGVIDSIVKETQYCPVHQTRLMMNIEDGIPICTHCGHSSTSVDTSVDVPSNEDTSSSRGDNQLNKVLKWFDHPPSLGYIKRILENNSELETVNEGVSGEDISQKEFKQLIANGDNIQEEWGFLKEAVKWCRDILERRKIRGLKYNRVMIDEVITWLKTNKELSVKFGRCHLIICSFLNGVEIPWLTSDECNIIQKLMLIIREPLQSLRPAKTSFIAEFAFIKICQILAIKHHKSFVRFIPWIRKLTTKDRLHKQEQYWSNVTRFAGLPTINGQDVLTEDTIRFNRKKYNIDTAVDDL